MIAKKDGKSAATDRTLSDKSMFDMSMATTGSGFGPRRSNAMYSPTAVTAIDEELRKELRMSTSGVVLGCMFY